MKKREFREAMQAVLRGVLYEMLTAWSLGCNCSTSMGGDQWCEQYDSSLRRWKEQIEAVSPAECAAIMVIGDATAAPPAYAESFHKPQARKMGFLRHHMAQVQKALLHYTRAT